jgi:hypothetical protein
MYIYAGLFLTALATLAFEIVLTRLLSVVSWYHLAFFAVSTAMLGMTAGAVTVFLNENSFKKNNISSSTAAAAIAFGLSIPFALAVICFTPIIFKQTFSSVFSILQASFACILPFYFSGIVITGVLTKQAMPLEKLYASDLAGASLGCLFVLWGMDLMDAPNLILLCAPVAALSGLFFALKAKNALLKNAAVISLNLLLLLLFANMALHFISPRTLKETNTAERIDVFEKWNSFSRVTVLRRTEGFPSFWGPSPAAPQYLTARFNHMVIDGLAGTYALGMNFPSDAEYLKYDMVNLAYHFRRGADTCVIGVGGGRDVACAVGFGQKSVIGIEVNPIFINDLLKGRMRKFTKLADLPQVRFVVDDARSYLARSKEKFGLIQMSLIDTWAATGAGAFSLTENGLYTVEAWKIFLDRLDDGGIFTVSRWFNPEEPGETARIVNLAKTALFNRGASAPDAHIVLVYLGTVSTIMVCERPYTAAELAEIKEVCAKLQFNIMVFPGEVPANIYLRQLMAAQSVQDLNASVAAAPLNYSAPTDETPFFFNMMKLGNVDFVLNNSAGVIKGNLLANLTLLVLIAVLLFFTAVIVVIPLMLGKKVREKIRVPAAAYFSLIGAGFMLAEIALIQKLSVFLGHPAYGLGILLFSMIASAGAGSYFSESLALDKKPWTLILPSAIGSYILLLMFLMPIVTGAMVSFGMTAKIAAVLVMIIPLGTMMGMCFPAGMRMINQEKSSATPWYWALNGIFGVLCSALAVFISIYFGISTNLIISALCYFSLIYFIPGMGRK